MKKGACRTLKREDQMAAKSIPDEVKAQVLEIVDRFNRKQLHRSGRRYIPRFKGKHLYLDRDDLGAVGPICRLEYRGGMAEWEFAIFKYSSETYDPEEWMFPGSEHVDGTVEGALKAGTEAYP